MKLTVACVAVLVALAATYAAADASSAYTEFQSFLTKFGKSYENPSEFMTRFGHFTKSLARIANLRSLHKNRTGENADHIYGITRFSDLSPEEFKRNYLGFKKNRAARETVSISSMLPQNKMSLQTTDTTMWDWTQHGATTPVKDQQQCGCCWAFSATEEVESMYQRQHGTLMSLSVQQITSCDTNDGGCGGGDTVSAYKYVQSAGGLEADSTYPFTSGNGNSGTCNFDPNQLRVKIDSMDYAVPPCDSGSCDNQDENTLQSTLLSVGPISICVNASPWQDYTGGVMSTGCSHGADDLDHCVQLVGFNRQASPNYWIVRNQWNTNWGNNGFIYLGMGSNVCGVANEATYLSVSAV